VDHKIALSATSSNSKKQTQVKAEQFMEGCVRNFKCTRNSSLLVDILPISPSII
jgi:hypothetical protein